MLPGLAAISGRQGRGNAFGRILCAVLAIGACRLRHMAGRRSAVSIFFLGGFNRNGQCAYLGAFVGLSNHAGSVRELGNLGVLAP